MKMQSYDVFTVKLHKEKTVELDIDNEPITSTEQAAEIVKLVADINDSTVEKFGIICLNVHGFVVGVHILAIGSSTEVKIEQKEVWSSSYLNNANHIILFHNHPGGDPSPSVQDVIRTQRMMEDGYRMHVPVYDHIIVSHDKYYSFREKNRIDFDKKIEFEGY